MDPQHCGRILSKIKDCDSENSFKISHYINSYGSFIPVIKSNKTVNLNSTEYYKLRTVSKIMWTIHGPQDFHLKARS